jgi:hypothetical protein
MWVEPRPISRQGEALYTSLGGTRQGGADEAARRAGHDPPLRIDKMAAYAFGSNPPTHADRNRTNGNGGLLRSRSFRKLNKTAPAIGNFDQDAVLANIFLLSHDFAAERLIEAAGADILSKNPRACPL